MDLPRKRRWAMLRRTLEAARRGPQPQSFPPLRADLLPPMQGRVEVVRDVNGVPHIYAEQEPDLYRALGYVQGADRFALLDVLRHLGSGRLTELIGNPRLPKKSDLFAGRGVVDLDAFVRPLAFEANSRAAIERLSQRGRNCAEAYAQGINAALVAMQGVYPPEYLVLGAVRPWTAADALLCAQTCAFTVALAPLDIELVFDAIRGQLGDDRAKHFFPEAPWQNVPTTYRNMAGGDPNVPLHLGGTGSNNWAVSGARSASGAPIVANDPHVPFLPLPTFWYHAHLDCPQYRIQGGMMLGCPIFGYGHNGALAWGVTTAYRDGWDLYRITRSPSDTSRYRTAAGEGELARHRELHYVRFGRDRLIEWESCEHGIVYPGWKHHDGTDLALRYVPADLARYFDGYLQLASATTVDAHRAALESINDGPFDFNHLYAHKDGHIAWEPFGRLPRRRQDGLFVRDAHDPDAQWDGFLPYAENPKMVNPARGFVCSANAITDPNNYRQLTTAVHPEPPHRQARIEAFLGASDQHTTETFAALQTDIGSDYGVPLRDALLVLLDHAGPLSTSTTAARALLAAWDGRFECTSQGAPLYALTLIELARRTWTVLLGDEIGHRFLNTRRSTPRLQSLLLDEGDPLRADIERAAGRPLSALVAEAFAAATQRLARQCGAEPSSWRWGTIHRLRLATLFGEVPLLGRVFRALDVPFAGDGYTVSPSISVPIGGTLRSFAGATSRFICDLAKPDEALFAHSSGPSGDIGSTYFTSTTDAWYRFEYFRSALWKAVEVPNVTERMVVEP